ncbi:MAG: cytochrome c [Bdellovibrionales bacterium]
MIGWRLFLVGMLMFGAGFACTKQAADSAAASATDLISQGKSVYIANCTACHNMDPRLDGSIGPGIGGASLELIERRVVHGDYPANYKPKRQSRSMVALPHLKDSVEALHAYVNNL